MMLANFLLMAMVATTVNRSTSLIISAPPLGTDVTRWKQETQKATIKTTNTEALTVRIRSTQESDLEEISDLLACANLQILTKQQLNWKMSMELLRTKATLQSLLFHRYQAIVEAKKKSHALLDCSIGEWASSLWDHASFRNKLSKAANLSNEPHLWKEHNFALAPTDPSMLQHKMMTAQNVRTGEIVGFCEIAMLSLPSEKDNVDGFDDSGEACAPTIMNLVISPEYRRRGIASGLLESAARVTRYAMSRPTSNLGLYVDEANAGAVQLYSKHGFKKVALANKQWYMSRALCAS